MWLPDMRATYSRGGIIRLRTCWPARTISIPPILLRVNGKRVFVPAVVSIDDTRFASSCIKLLSSLYWLLAQRRINCDRTSAGRREPPT